MNNKSKLAGNRPDRASWRFGFGVRGAILSVGSITAGILAAAILFGGTAQAAPDDTAIRQAASDAVISEQMAPVLPPGGNAAMPITQAVSQTMVDRGHADLAKHFASKELDRRDATVKGLIDRQTAGDVRILAAGVDSFKVTSVTISGDEATVSATGVVWRDIAQVQTNGSLVVASPRNDMLFTLTLQDIKGTWLVVDQNVKYAPGSEP